MKIQTLAGCVGRHDKLHFSGLDQLLDSVALHTDELAVAKESALARTGVDSNHLVWEVLRKLRGHPVGRVVVLREDDAAQLTPRLSTTAVLAEKPAHCVQFWVNGLGSRKLIADRRGSTTPAPSEDESARQDWRVAPWSCATWYDASGCDTLIQRFSSLRQRLDHVFLANRLKGARSYKRIAGYFRSSILELVGEQIEDINDVRIVCNSELDPHDVMVSKAAREVALKARWNQEPIDTEAFFHRERYRRLYKLLSSGRVQIKVDGDAVTVLFFQDAVQ